DGGNLAVGVDGQISGLVLVAAAEVQRDLLVGQGRFVQINGDFLAVGRVGSVEGERVLIRHRGFLSFGPQLELQLQSLQLQLYSRKKIRASADGRQRAAWADCRAASAAPSRAVAKRACSPASKRARKRSATAAW